MKKILTDIPHYCPVQLPEGYELVKVDMKTISTYDGNQDVEFVLCSRALARKTQEIELPEYKLLHLFSVGYDDVDLNVFKQKGIPVCNAAGIYDNVVAEYVVYAMLLYAKRFHRSLKNRLFRPFRNYHYITEVAGKTVGIMGCGRIGTAVAKHLSGFGVEIIAYAKNTCEKEGFSKIYHREDIAKFFAKSDYIINTLPHDSSTIGLIDKALLDSCKSAMTFINIGRESIFNGDDFYQYLKSHKDATAILDMFELIPNPVTNKYRRLSNVLVMPRVASISQESDINLKELMRMNVEAILNKRELRNRVV